MEDKFVPSGLVEDWRFRYTNKWCTDFHVEMLLRLNIINEIEAIYIKTGEVPRNN